MSRRPETASRARGHGAAQARAPVPRRADERRRPAVAARVLGLAVRARGSRARRCSCRRTTWTKRNAAHGSRFLDARPHRRRRHAARTDGEAAGPHAARRHADPRSAQHALRELARRDRARADRHVAARAGRARRATSRRRVDGTAASAEGVAGQFEPIAPNFEDVFVAATRKPRGDSAMKSPQARLDRREGAAAAAPRPADVRDDHRHPDRCS